MLSRGLIGSIFVNDFSGYLVPKGWRIYVYTREINYDPILYHDPLTFNPWRWLVSNNLLFLFCYKKHIMKILRTIINKQLENAGK
jgi:hypothetical protein